MKILFITPVLEYPAAGGPQLRIKNSIKALNMVADLYVYASLPISSMGGTSAVNFFAGICKEIYFSNNTFNYYTTNFLQQKIEENQRRYTQFMKKEVNYIKSLCERINVDILWFGYGNISYELISEIKRQMPNKKVVCDTDSVWSRFLLRELPYERSIKKKLDIFLRGKEKEFQEIKLVKLCDCTTAVSEVDAEYYRNITKNKEKIKVFSNVIDLEDYSGNEEKDTNVTIKKPCIYLAGTFWRNSPMEKASRWIINDVLPLVKSEVPNIHFYIIGKGSDKILKDISRSDITITGKVDSVLPYLKRADVSLVPLAFESGTRYKILEAAACNIPIVSTTLGAEGIPVKNNENIIIADNKEDFSEGIIKIIKDKNLGEYISRKCNELIRKQYSVEYLRNEAQIILESLKWE